MGRDRRNEMRVEQFTKWLLHEKQLPAWKALSFPAREAYMHLRIRCFAETAQKNKKVANNNGEVYLSARKLAGQMGCNVKTAMAAMADLQAKGWIVVNKPHSLGVDGRGEAPHFRLTMMPKGQGKTMERPTKEPTRWKPGHDFEVLVYSSLKPVGRTGDAKQLNKRSVKKQNPAPDCGAPLNQIVEHSHLSSAKPAPDFGAEIAHIDSKPEPVCGSYLTAISLGGWQRSVEAGNGLCGKARLN